MATTLSIRDYLGHFLFSTDRVMTLDDRIGVANGPSKPRSPVRRITDVFLSPPSPVKIFQPAQPNYGLMLARVCEVVGDGHENLIYSKRIAGHKNMNVFGIFVQDMIGSKMLKAARIMDGRMSRGSILSDVNGIGAMDVEEGRLRPGTTVTISLISSRSPSNIGSTGLLGLLDHCHRNKIRATVDLKFAHAFAWDNKYNREGLSILYSNGVKISSLSFPQILQSLFNDIREDLESLNDLQACRGSIAVDGGRIEMALTTLRQSVTIASDSYHQDQKEQLAAITGKKSNLPKFKKYSQLDLPAGLSMEMYRECILLQNTEMKWGKIRIAVNKVGNGTTKEEVAFEKVLSVTDKTTPMFQKNSNRLKDLDLNAIWEEVQMETTVRFAHSVDGPIPVAANGSENGVRQTMGFPRGMTVECIHVRDILSEMLGDLEDSIRYLGGLEYNRGANLCVQSDGVTHAMGELNRAIKVRTGDGEFSMNEDFDDRYALDFNGT